MGELDDYAALRQFLAAMPQALRLEGILERALLLKAEIPDLEKKKAALTAEIKQARELRDKMLTAVKIVRADTDAQIQQIARERNAEAKLLEEDRAHRAKEGADGAERLKSEHASLAKYLASIRDQLQDDVTALQKRKAELEKGLTEIAAAASRR